MGAGDTGTDELPKSREHTDCIPEGGRDNWIQVKHIREGQTITEAGKWTMGGRRK